MKHIDTRTADFTDSMVNTTYLLIAADAACDVNNTKEERHRASALVTTLLDAAQKGGFKQRDTLHKLLQRVNRSDHAAEMARQACAFIPNIAEIEQKFLAGDLDD